MGWLHSGALPKPHQQPQLKEEPQQAVWSRSLGLSSGGSFLGPSVLDASPALAALRAAVLGLYTGGATRSGDSIAARVYGRAGRMKECRLSRVCVRHTGRHACGWGGVGEGGGVCGGGGLLCKK